MFFGNVLSPSQIIANHLCPQAMESKLLMGGKNIVDHTNEQQRALEQRRQEIADRKVSYHYQLEQAWFSPTLGCISVISQIVRKP